MSHWSGFIGGFDPDSACGDEEAKGLLTLHQSRSLLKSVFICSGGRNPLRKWLTEVCEHHRESRTVNRGSRLRAGSPSGRFCFFFTLQTSRLASTQTSLVNILWCTSSRLMSPKLIYKLNTIPYFYYKHGWYVNKCRLILPWIIDILNNYDYEVEIPQRLNNLLRLWFICLLVSFFLSTEESRQSRHLYRWARLTQPWTLSRYSASNAT